MPLIRLNTGQLRKSAEQIAESANRLRMVADSIASAANEARSYEGHFRPEVMAIGVAGQARAKTASNPLMILSQNLFKFVALIEQIEAFGVDFASDLLALSPALPSTDLDGNLLWTLELTASGVAGANTLTLPSNPGLQINFNPWLAPQGREWKFINPNDYFLPGDGYFYMPDYSQYRADDAVLVMFKMAGELSAVGEVALMPWEIPGFVTPTGALKISGEYPLIRPSGTSTRPSVTKTYETEVETGFTAPFIGEATFSPYEWVFDPETNTWTGNPKVELNAELGPLGANLELTESIEFKIGGQIDELIDISAGVNYLPGDQFHILASREAIDAAGGLPGFISTFNPDGYQYDGYLYYRSTIDDGAETSGAQWFQMVNNALGNANSEYVYIELVDSSVPGGAPHLSGPPLGFDSEGRPIQGPVPPPGYQPSPAPGSSPPASNSEPPLGYDDQGNPIFGPAPAP